MVICHRLVALVVSNEELTTSMSMLLAAEPRSMFETFQLDRCSVPSVVFGGNNSVFQAQSFCAVLHLLVQTRGKGSSMVSRWVSLVDSTVMSFGG